MRRWLRRNWPDVPGYGLATLLLLGALAGITAFVVWAVGSGHWWLAPLVLLFLAIPFAVWRSWDEL